MRISDLCLQLFWILFYVSWEKRAREMKREDSELLHGLVEVAKGGRKFPWYDLRAPFIFFFSTWQTDYPLPPPIYFLVRFVLISSSIEQDLYIQKCLYNKHYFFLNSHRVWIYKISFPFLKKSFVTSLSCVYSPTTRGRDDTNESNVCTALQWKSSREFVALQNLFNVKKKKKVFLASVDGCRRGT